MLNFCCSWWDARVTTSGSTTGLLVSTFACFAGVDQHCYNLMHLIDLCQWCCSLFHPTLLLWAVKIHSPINFMHVCTVCACLCLLPFTWEAPRLLKWSPLFSAHTSNFKGDMLCSLPWYFYSGTPLEYLCMIHRSKNRFLMLPVMQPLSWASDWKKH